MTIFWALLLSCLITTLLLLLCGLVFYSHDLAMQLREAEEEIIKLRTERANGMFASPNREARMARKLEALERADRIRQTR